MSPAPRKARKGLRSSLFIRIFLWFCLAMILTTVLSIVVGFVVRPEDANSHRRSRRFDEHLRRRAAEAVRIFEAEGEEALERFEEEQVPMPDFRFRIFRERGQDMRGRASSEELARGIDRAFDRGQAHVPGERHLRAQRVVGPSGTRYVVAYPTPPDFKGRGRMSMLFHLWFGRARRVKWAPILAVLAAGLLLCYGLALHLTRPIAGLRGVAQRMAEGQLAVRTDPSISSRSDELGDLARDFDAMVGRIDELLRSRQRLFADISHELRSPLTRITVALEIAREGTGREKALDRIARDVERLDVLVGELLTLTRLQDTGDLRSLSEGIDLAALVRELVRDASFEAESLGKTLEEGEIVEATILGRTELLRRAFENVLRNAVAYTDEGTAVRFDLCRAAGELRFRVRDHGPGVPPDDLEKIFEPFYRSEEARDRRAGGVGLGLAISRRAVELHGGSIEARLADDGGLIVELSLPDEAEVAESAASA